MHAMHDDSLVNCTRVCFAVALLWICALCLMHAQHDHVCIRRDTIQLRSVHQHVKAPLFPLVAPYWSLKRLLLFFLLFPIVLVHLPPHPIVRKKFKSPPNPRKSCSWHRGTTFGCFLKVHSLVGLRAWFVLERTRIDAGTKNKKLKIVFVKSICFQKGLRFSVEY